VTASVATIKSADIHNFAGFMLVGFLLNFLIGGLAYLLLRLMSSLRRVDTATIAGYYGSDSAGTFAACVAVLTSVGIAFIAWMPVMLAVMEIPGCLVALYLVARLRHRGMDTAGFMPDEPGYTPPVTVGVGPGTAARPLKGQSLETEHERGIEQELELSMERLEHPDWDTNFLNDVPKLLKWSEDNFVNVNTPDGLPGNYKVSWSDAAAGFEDFSDMGYRPEGTVYFRYQVDTSGASFALGAVADVDGNNVYQQWADVHPDTTGTVSTIPYGITVPPEFREQVVQISALDIY